MDLWLMQSGSVTVLMDDVGIFGGKGRLYYQYSDPSSGEQYVFRSDEVMHFKTWYSMDGIMGKPVREILRDTVGGALESQNFMNKLYEQWPYCQHGHAVTSGIWMRSAGKNWKRNTRTP